jgi:hypothetical protein
MPDDWELHEVVIPLAWKQFLTFVTITDGYDRVREDVGYRKEVAATVGVGFTIPAVVVQKSVESSKIVVAVEVQELVATL